MRLSFSTSSSNSSLFLLAQIERHEKDAVDREQAYRDLERHAALLDTSKENKLLLEELVEKDKRISSLERQTKTSPADWQAWIAAPVE
jgi:hypothetical protein